MDCPQLQKPSEQMPKKILFLTLQTFSAAGGIQRMGRNLAYVLQRLGQKHKWAVKLHALYDRQNDLLPAYLPPENFKAFNRNKLKYTIASVWAGSKADLVILSHINLSLIGCLIRLLNPNCKIWLIAHGIEVWQPLGLWKKAIWRYCDKIICVSGFTQEKVITLHQAPLSECVILNPIPDPFLAFPAHFDKPAYLQERYRIKIGEKVIFTLTRISSSEHYKGYTQTLIAIGKLNNTAYPVKYILAGPYDEAEKASIIQLAAGCGLKDRFILAGYIPEDELGDHFLLADLFVLPSKKEGFGIVFAEAMAFGLPVICGNADGSLDAVKNDRMGTAIDPDNPEALQQAIAQKLGQALNTEERKNIQAECLKYFNLPGYMKQLEKLINEETIA